MRLRTAGRGGVSFSCRLLQLHATLAFRAIPSRLCSRLAMPLHLFRPLRASPSIILARTSTLLPGLRGGSFQTNKKQEALLAISAQTCMNIQKTSASSAAAALLTVPGCRSVDPPGTSNLSSLLARLTFRPFVSAATPSSVSLGSSLARQPVGAGIRHSLSAFCPPQALKRPLSRHNTSLVFVRVSMTEGSMEPMLGKRIGFIGAGQMAEALARGWDKQGLLPANRMVCTDVHAGRLEVFRSFGAHPCADSKEVAAQSDIIFVAVKPYTVHNVLTELRDSGSLLERHVIVSIAAGVTLANLQSWAGERVRVVRVMPNTPCLVGQTAAAMSVGAHATVADADLVRRMFSTVGTIHTVEEKLLDAVTGLSGSGPAYVFVAIEALADGGVAAGLPRDVALSLAAQTVLGGAQMVVETGKHPGVLKDQVASPGGTTIAGLHELEKGGFRALLMNAVLAAAKRSKEMS